MEYIDVKLRDAAIEDAEFLFIIRYSKEFAKHFLDTGEISTDEHRA
jgi:hypothetical protein